MKKIAISFLVPLLISVFTLLMIEGAYSVARWEQAERSLTYGIVANLRHATDRGQKLLSQSGLPLAGRENIESLIPAMIEAGVGMGNVPYQELLTERAAMNGIGPDGCRSPKPNIRKLTTYIRSDAYDRFDPPSMFYDMDAALGDPLLKFINTYGVRQARFTSNAVGERTTLPPVSATKKILIAGDSVAAGSMIDDSETISSHLQRENRDVQYVNLGVNDASAAETICRLRKAADRYKGAISGLIYVYCENDFDPQETFGRPEEVVAWLKEFASQQNIPRMTIVFAPYIYNIVPHLTRFSGSRGAEHRVYAEASGRLKEEALSAGFNYVSIGDVALEEGKERGSDFAVFGLFVDHVHLSDYGVSLLARKLPRD